MHKWDINTNFLKLLLSEYTMHFKRVRNRSRFSCCLVTIPQALRAVRYCYTTEHFSILYSFKECSVIEVFIVLPMASAIFVKSLFQSAFADHDTMGYTNQFHI